MYKITFTEIELNKLNTIENDDMRKSLMSVYSFIKKDISLHISYASMLKRFNRCRNNLTLSTFKRRILKLVDLDLLIVKVVDKKSLFTLVSQNVNQNVDCEENHSKQDISTDSEEVENTQRRNIKKDLDIDNKSTSTLDAISLPVVPTTEKTEIAFIGEGYEKVSSWSDIANDLVEAFRVAKVRSKKVKSEVICKIENNLENITKRFSYNYILKTVYQVKTQFDSFREKYRNIIFQDKYKKYNKSSFCNFEQREYEFKELESKLLGW